MQPDTDTPAPDPTTRNHAPRIMVWHIRAPADADADETLNRVILHATDDDGEAWASTEINAGAPVL